MVTKLYTCFHLNLMFSSIEEDQRLAVIKRCYWPLLTLAEEGFPLGLEASGKTLLIIQDLDPKWIETCKNLIQQGKLDFVASGYQQIISPLWPAAVTRANLREGLALYDALLGVRPSLALINEQAFSNQLIPLYKEAGFDAVMMDWADAASHEERLDRSSLDRPQRLKAPQSDAEITVLWSDAISFQKFQRYLHHEYFTAEYLDFLGNQLARKPAAFPLYTSDAEILNFRAKRFDAETSLDDQDEVARLRALLLDINRRTDCVLALPSDALTDCDDLAKPFTLGTASNPIPVKKQMKYNITRWGLTGRDDMVLNTHVHRLLSASADVSRALLDLCASDYRTHITKQRWDDLLKKLPPAPAPEKPDALAKSPPTGTPLTHWEEGRFLYITGGGVHLVLNLFRGLAVRAFGFGPISPLPAGGLPPESLMGTLPHGYYTDIRFGADFYSGHLVIEPHDQQKIADLQKLETYSVQISDGCADISATLSTRLGTVTKTLTLDARSQSLETRYDLGFTLPPLASARLAHLTLNPEAFDRDTLFYRVGNGGELPDHFSLRTAATKGDIAFGNPVSRLVSASTALGMTDGSLILGDTKKAIRLSMAREDAAGLGLLHVTPVDDTAFIRAMISIQETDETSRPKADDGPSTALCEPRLKYRFDLLDRDRLGPIIGALVSKGLS